MTPIADAKDHGRTCPGRPDDRSGCGHAILRHLPAAIAEAALIEAVRELDADPAIDGILVQPPLPPHIALERVRAAIDPAKDVDGFLVVNAGRLAIGLPGPVPCTPRACLLLLQDELGPRLAGRHAVVLGRSAIVGRPAAALMLRQDCTATIAHSRTSDIGAVIRTADILVTAAILVAAGTSRISSAATGSSRAPW